MISADSMECPNRSEELEVADVVCVPETHVIGSSDVPVYFMNADILNWSSAHDALGSGVEPKIPGSTAASD